MLCSTMRNKSQADEILRKFEREVLDPHHKSFALWGQPESIRLYGVMAAFDSMMLPIVMANDGNPPTVGYSQYLKKLGEGLVYAIRWLTGESSKIPKPEAVPTPAILEQGADLLFHAMDYSVIADMHIAYGRGMFNIDVNRDTKVVRFLPKGGDVPVWAGFADGQLNTVRTARNRINSIPKQSAIAPYESVLFTCGMGNLTLHNPNHINTSPLTSCFKKMIPEETYKVDSKGDFGGFSAGDFERFWEYLFSWSMHAIHAFLHFAQQGMDQSLCMPTQMVSASLFASSASTATGLITI